jgi:hypothetical protein
MIIEGVTGSKEEGSKKILHSVLKTKIHAGQSFISMLHDVKEMEKITLRSRTVMAS